MPPGVVGDVELHGRLLAWTLSNQQLPGVPYALKVSSEPLVFPLAAADDCGVDLTQIPLPEAVTYPGHEALEIPALLYRPVAAARGSEGPVPFVIMFHGGPESQARPDCRRFVAWLQSRGFGVLRPNVRGSTGYGRAYQLLDDGPRRMDAVRDGVRAAEWLVEQGMAERGRIASFGGSYGGFMAVATAIEGGPELFGACVNYVGIVNFETFLERTKPYRRAHREAEYGGLDDREFLRSISPLFAVDRLDVPVLIAHGLNDPRVPIDESMQLALALQSRGLNPETIYFPDEGHGFRKLANRTLFYRRVADFFARSIAAPVP
jgi:dipeptidyl aminopeptidase/acylaminoacyl peptidase